MTTVTLRAAIIGTSRVGSFFDERLAATPELIPSSHAGCYAAHPRTRLVAGCDLIPERRDYMKEVYRCPVSYPSLEEMLKDPDLDAIDVGQHRHRQSLQVGGVLQLQKVCTDACGKHDIRHNFVPFWSKSPTRDDT